MNDLLSPLSLRRDRPLEGWRIEVLEALDAVFREHNYPYMLVGATARDLLLFHVHGGPYPSRRTRDIDFAIAVDSWKAFDDIRSILLGKSNFHLSRVQHRLLYHSATVPETEVDILPFGRIASPEGTIIWPPEFDTVMSVLGFEEALSAAVWISITGGLTVPVVSLPGLAILKLFAWSDRKSDGDATDLYRVIRSYADAGNEDRLYNSPVAEEFSFDLELAGAKLLGIDTAALCRPATLRKLTEIFTPEVIEKLVSHMLRHDYRLDDSEKRMTQLATTFFDPILRHRPAAHSHL